MVFVAARGGAGRRVGVEGFAEVLARLGEFFEAVLFHAVFEVGGAGGRGGEVEFVCGGGGVEDGVEASGLGGGGGAGVEGFGEDFFGAEGAIGVVR